MLKKKTIVSYWLLAELSSSEGFILTIWEWKSADKRLLNISLVSGNRFSLAQLRLVVNFTLAKFINKSKKIG